MATLFHRSARICLPNLSSSSTWRRAYSYIPPSAPPLPAHFLELAQTPPTDVQVTGKTSTPVSADLTVAAKSSSRRHGRLLDSSHPETLEIDELVVAGKFSAALAAFRKLRFQGLDPSLQTYELLLSHLASAADNEQQQTVLRNAQHLFFRYIEVAPRYSPSARVSVTHYLTVLSNLEHDDEVLRVFYSLHRSRVANARTYKIVFSILAKRLKLLKPHMAPTTTSQALSLWRHMISVVRRYPELVVDSELVEQAVYILARGTKADKWHASEIVHDWIDSGLLPLTQSLAFRITELFIQRSLFSACIDWVKKQTNERPETLGRNVMYQALLACACLSLWSRTNQSAQALEILNYMKQAPSFTLLPSKRTYAITMIVTWLSKDWVSAKQVFELAMGTTMEEYKLPPQSLSSTPDFEEEHPLDAGRIGLSDRIIFSHLVKTALASNEVANMLECLHFISRIDGPWDAPFTNNGISVAQSRFVVHEMAEAVQKMAEQVLELGETNLGEKSMHEVTMLKDEAIRVRDELVKGQLMHSMIPVPVLQLLKRQMKREERFRAKLAKARSLKTGELAVDWQEVQAVFEENSEPTPTSNTPSAGDTPSS